MDSLNDLLNKSLGTSGVNYTESKENISKCFDLFSKLSETDDICLEVTMYLFPFCSLVEKNENSFWFVKYKNDQIYDEFDFAIALIKAYIVYKSNKDLTLFESRVKASINEFGTYKNIPDFLSAIGNYPNTVFAIIAYLTQDYKYFQDILGLNSVPLNIQSPEFIADVKKLLESKNEIQHLKGLVKKLQSTIYIKCAQYEDYKNSAKKNEETLFQNIKKLESKVSSLSDRIGKIDLRDTLMMSFKFLYKILYTRYPGKEYLTNFWDQISEIKDILTKPEFANYKFIIEFIKDIQFTELSSLNSATHDDTEKERNLSDIRQYMQNYSNEDLNKVVEFFKKLPYIQEFINIHMTFYFNPKDADEKFQKKIRYSDAFQKVFK
jgi:hypothetical protein